MPIPRKMIGALWFGVLLVAIPLPLGYKFGKGIWHQYLLRERGITSNAQAINISHRHLKFGDGYNVDYAFEYRGITYRGTFSARKDWAKSSPIPTTIKVRFLPDNPAVSWPPEIGLGNPLWVGVLFFCAQVVIALFLLAAVYACLFGLWRKREVPNNPPLPMPAPRPVSSRCRPPGLAGR